MNIVAKKKARAKRFIQKFAVEGGRDFVVSILCLFIGG